MIDDCTGLVLAGGESRRMGSDKTVLVWDGATLLERACTRLQAIFPRVLVSLRQPREGLAWEQVLDQAGADGALAGPLAGALAGPLAGLAAGLAAARTPWVFVLAADMPLISVRTIEALAARRSGSQAVVPVAGGVLQPLAAFYPSDALPEIEALLATPGRHGPRALLERIGACRVDERDLRPGECTPRPGECTPRSGERTPRPSEGKPNDSNEFFDVDTPQDWEAARHNRESCP